jgi:hypothetical protein
MRTKKKIEERGGRVSRLENDKEAEEEDYSSV